MSNKKSFLDMDVLARGCKIEDDTPSYPMEIPYIPPAQQTMYQPQNMMPFVQPQPILQSIPQAEVKIQGTYETPDGTPSYPMEIPYIPPAQQTIYQPQNMMPFVQPQPILQSIPQAEVKVQDTYETPEEYLFWEEDNLYEIHVTVISNLKKEMAGSNHSIYDARAKSLFSIFSR